jgi:hypothetical protein
MYKSRREFRPQRSGVRHMPPGQEGISREEAALLPLAWAAKVES